MTAGPVGRTAADLSAMVRGGEVTPVEVIRAHLDHIGLLDPRVGAFRSVRAAKAIAEAEEVAGRPDLADLPLAGVPIAVKDNLAVAGEPVRLGSSVSPDAPSTQDHEAVRRVRAAGGVVVGITRMPELGLWSTTDGPFGTARNPWDLDRTPGGSSGGGAAAVAAGMAPIALATDGFGSIRIPGAACGLVGLKPGPHVTPGFDEDPSGGMTVTGVLATTVEDAALGMSVLADRPELRRPQAPDHALRVAVSVDVPLPGLRLDRGFLAAAVDTGALLSGAGHEVTDVRVRFAARDVAAVLGRWFAAAGRASEGLDRTRLEARTRRHAAVGRAASRLVSIREGDRETMRRRLEARLGAFDLVVIPALGARPPKAEGWHRRGWFANVFGSIRFAPFGAAWNLAGYPAVVVPAGIHPEGTPLSVQLVASPGGEGLLLWTAAQLESLRPWTRHAPLAGV